MIKITDELLGIFNSMYLIDKNTNCWNWTGWKDGSGYGSITYHKTTIKAHRLSCIIFKGPIPNNKLCLHTCDNRQCVNPDHLYYGSHGDNNLDRYNRNPNNQGGIYSRLKEGEVWLIKRLYKSGKFSQLFISKMFKVDRSVISKIVTGKTTHFLPNDMVLLK